jgi:hypothetical protein
LKKNRRLNYEYPQTVYLIGRNLVEIAEKFLTDILKHEFSKLSGSAKFIRRML